MADWREEVAKIKGGVMALDRAIAKYLELTGNPDKVPVGDIETVCQLTGILSPTISREDFESTLYEFIIYHGFDPDPKDGHYVRYPKKVS